MLDASKHSMGMDISDIDLLNIDTFAVRVMKLAGESQWRLKDLILWML